MQATSRHPSREWQEDFGNPCQATRNAADRSPRFSHLGLYNMPGRGGGCYQASVGIVCPGEGLSKRRASLKLTLELEDCQFAGLLWLVDSSSASKCRYYSVPPIRKPCVTLYSFRLHNLVAPNPGRMDIPGHEGQFVCWDVGSPAVYISRVSHGGMNFGGCLTATTRTPQWRLQASRRTASV